MAITAGAPLRRNETNPGSRRRIGGVILSIFLAAIVSAPGFAEDSSEGDHDDGVATHGGTQQYRNHFSGILGWSHVDNGEDSGTFGMEYLRLLTRRFGISAYVEISEGQFKADTAGFLFEGMPVKNWIVYAGPGIERSLFENHEYLLRVGTGYMFHTRGVTLTPLAMVDFVEDHKIYFLGIGIGKSF